MLYQLKNHKDGTIKAFSLPALLQHEVLRITGDSTEAANVGEWASTPVFGCFRYDHTDFEITIIGQPDVYQG